MGKAMDGWLSRRRAPKGAVSHFQLSIVLEKDGGRQATWRAEGKSWEFIHGERKS